MEGPRRTDGPEALEEHGERDVEEEELDDELPVPAAPEQRRRAGRPILALLLDRALVGT